MCCDTTIAGWGLKDHMYKTKKDIHWHRASCVEVHTNQSFFSEQGTKYTSKRNKYIYKYTYIYPNIFS